MDSPALVDRLAAVRERIEAARRRAGRSDAVTLIAVTKTQPPATMRAALAAGLTDLGENRVAELEQKIEQLGRAAARWHFVGHLQRNKVRRALPLFDLLHSLDSLRLAEQLAAEAERRGGTVEALVQVNTSGEASKSGLAAAEALETIARMAELPRLRLVGLMTMAPFTADEAVLRRTFRAARRLWEEAGRQVAGFEARHLSMGMSNDFEIAVEEGSTMLRLGTVLFGERER